MSAAFTLPLSGMPPRGTQTALFSLARSDTGCTISANARTHTHTHTHTHTNNSQHETAQITYNHIQEQSYVQYMSAFKCSRFTIVRVSFLNIQTERAYYPPCNTSQ
jgi:hypothetical protein